MYENGLKCNGNDLKGLKLMDNEIINEFFNEDSPDLISLLDDEGKEHEFEILDMIDNDRGCFYALLPVLDEDSEGFEEWESCYFIFEAIENEDGPQMAEVEDEELLKELSEKFEARFEQMYDQYYSDGE